jgi:hypothetical protein
MFDNIKDSFAKISIHRLQKRIDALKAHQEMLDKFTQQRTLSELPCWNEHRGRGDDSASPFNGDGDVVYGVVRLNDIPHTDRHLGNKLSQDH